MHDSSTQQGGIASSVSKLYPPVGRCIYCGAERHSKRRSQLATEHIIPEGLNGQLLLPEASCGRCEGITGGVVEQWCQKQMLGALRYKLGLPTKRPKDRPKTLPVKFLIGNNWQIRQVNIADYPLALAMLYYRPPMILQPDLKLDHPNVHAFQFADCSSKAVNQRLMAELGASEMEYPSGIFKGERFSRMLAKIGHSFAVAELGLGRFRPLLLPVIFGDMSLVPKYVGGSLQKNPAKSPTQHEISLRRETRKGKSYLVARIRIFGDMGTPIYCVVAGEIHCDLVHHGTAGRP